MSRPKRLRVGALTSNGMLLVRYAVKVSTAAAIRSRLMFRILMVSLWHCHRSASDLTVPARFPKVFASKTSVATSQGGLTVTQTGAARLVCRVAHRGMVDATVAASIRVNLRGIAKLIGKYQRRRLFPASHASGRRHMDALPLAGNLSLYELFRQAVPETVLGAFAVIVVVALFLVLVAIWLWFWRPDKHSARATVESEEVVDFALVEGSGSALETAPNRKS